MFSFKGPEILVVAIWKSSGDMAWRQAHFTLFDPRDPLLKAGYHSAYDVVLSVVSLM